MNEKLLAFMAAMQQTISDIEKEVAHRCHETTSQKLQGMATAVEAMHGDLLGLGPDVVLGLQAQAPQGPDPMAVMVERVFKVMDDADAANIERAKIQADTVKVLEALVQGLGLADTPAAG